MSWTDKLKGDSLSWLLETSEPNVRYLALRNLMELPADDPDLAAARQKAHQTGPIATVLNAMNPEGYWVKPGAGYSPKYHGTVWSIILLAQLGASVTEDYRIEKACQYICDKALTEYGQFSYSGAPSGTFDCLQGNLCNALQDLGFTHPHLEAAFEWMARSQTGAGLAPQEDKTTPLRYYVYKCGPNFTCGPNDKLPCAWGAVKVMLAFGKIPPEKRTVLIQDAIQTGVDFLLGIDPAIAAYPTPRTNKPSGNWWKFGFPVFYITDLLQNVEALVRLGYGNDPRISNALTIIRDKQDQNGRWALETDYAGKTWVEFGLKKQPNKWVTLRAAWVLKNT
jgi:hypothetical protein